MGIITYCFKCEVCEEPFRIRYNLGNKYPQTAVFYCSECGETLKFGYDANQNVILLNILETQFDRGLKVVNLHPELTIDKSSKDNPTYFPSIEFLKRQSIQGPLALDIFFNAQASCIEYQNAWNGIRTDFRYLKECRWQLLEKEYGPDKTHVEHEILMRVLYTADFFLQGKWRNLADALRETISSACVNGNFSELKAYLVSFKRDFLFNKMYSAMNKYQHVESALLPTMLHQKCGFTPEGISSFGDWGSVEMLYGDFFEIYADLLIVPTVLNNLQSRGDYQMFNSPDFTLDKYLDSDKSRRADNFKTNAQFFPLSEFYDSSIRNGTHHQASTFDSTNQIVILKIGKGGRNKKIINLVNYIEHCNEIYARILIVLRSYYFIIQLTP